MPPSPRWTLLLLACAGGDGVDALPPSKDPVLVHTDSPTEPTADTEADTEPVIDSEASDTPPEDSDPPVDTSPPRPTPPTSLGAGFIDLLDATLQGHTIFAGELGGEWPDASWVVIGDLYGDGLWDVYAHGVRPPGSDAGPEVWGKLWTLDPASWTLTENPSLASAIGDDPPQGLAGILDLDDDGDDDLLRAGTTSAFGLVDDGVITWFDAALPPTRGFLGGLSAVTLADLDMDGWTDVVYSPDDCNRAGPDHVYLFGQVRTGPTSWRNYTTHLPQTPRGSGYAMMWTPLGPDLEPTLIAVGESCEGLDATATFFRIDRRDTNGWPVWEAVDPLPTDALFRFDPANPAQVIARLQPMGAAVTDLDLDGALDWVVALSTPELYLYGGTATEPMEERTLATPVPNPVGPRGNPQLPWGIAPLDLDADGRPDLTVAYGDDAGSTWQIPWNGPYHVRSWWNDGRGGYHDLSALTGLQREGSWHTLTVHDLDRDGDPDLGLGGVRTLPRLVRNELDAGNHQLGVRLRGSTSNRYAFGATVELQAAGLRPQLRVVGERASPRVVDEPTLFFGLGQATEATVRVRWPTGWVQETGPLAAGTLHELVEPPTIVLSDADRHLPADGVSTLVVEVFPRGTDGQTRPATVQIEAPWGSASFSGPAVQDGHVWRRTLVAPDANGSSVIEVVIDGVVCPVRPRVWWD